ncbi:MAG: chemotaxis protein CheW [Gemmataceae bacterium]
MPSVPLPSVQVVDCWNRVGVWGDRSCPELTRVIHCHNCDVFARAGRQFLDAPSPEGYLQEWTTRLAAPIEEQSADLVGVLVFRLAGEALALPVRVLVEVTNPRPIHRVPHRGGVLAGLVNIRGELYLAVHLDRVLNIERDATAAPAGGQPRLLVVRRESDRWVFPVDDVDQVRRLPLHALTGPPATVARSLARLTRGVFHQDGRSIGLIDDERLFATLRARAR